MWQVQILPYIGHDSGSDCMWQVQISCSRFRLYVTGSNIALYCSCGRFRFHVAGSDFMWQVQILPGIVPFVGSDFMWPVQILCGMFRLPVAGSNIAFYCSCGRVRLHTVSYPHLEPLAT